MPTFNQDNFWLEQSNAEDINKLLNLERLASLERERLLMDALKAALRAQTRKNADELSAATLSPFSNRADLAEKLLYLSGGNPSNILLGYDEPLSKIDKASLKLDIKELVNIAMGRDEITLMYSSKVAKGLLEQWYHKSKNGHPDYQDAINEALNDDIKRQLISLVKNQAVALDNVDAIALENFIKEQEKTIPKTDNDAKGNALLSTEELDREELAVRSRLDLESKKHLIVRTQKTDAQIEINILLDSHKNWATRTTKEKIKQVANEKVKDFLDPNGKLHYPSVDIFGESLDLMDENGRAKDTLLKFKRGYFGGPSVVFPKADVEEDVYKMAALKCKYEGIVKPHIHCTFKDPSTAIRFMKFTVDALVNAGYDIDDISVDRNIREAFENYKSERFIINQGVVREASNTEETEPKNKPLTQTEIDAANQLTREQRNEEINTPIQKARENIADGNDSVQLKDLTTQTIKDILERSHLLKGDPLSWADMQKKEGLNPLSRDSVEDVLRQVGKVLDAFDPESESFNIESMNKRSKQAKLLRDLGPQVLTTAFGIDKYQRTMPQIIAKIAADEGQPFNNQYIIDPKDNMRNNQDTIETPSNTTLETPKEDDPSHLNQDSHLDNDGPPPAPPIGDYTNEDIQQSSEQMLSLDGSEGFDGPPPAPPIGDYTNEDIQQSAEQMLSLDGSEGFDGPPPAPPIENYTSEDIEQRAENNHEHSPSTQENAETSPLTLERGDDKEREIKNKPLVDHLMELAAKLQADKASLSANQDWPNSSLLNNLNQRDIELLATVTHQAVGEFEREKNIPMRDKRIIREVSHRIQNLILDIKNPDVWESNPVSPLENRLLQTLPPAMIPESLLIRKRNESDRHPNNEAEKTPPRPAPPKPGRR